MNVCLSVRMVLYPYQMSVCLSEWFYTPTNVCLSVRIIPYPTKCLSVCPNDSIPLLKVCQSFRKIYQNEYRKNWTPPIPEGRGNGAEGAHLRVLKIAEKSH